MSVAMAAVDVSKTTLSLTCILFRAYCHVQRCPFSSYTSPFISHLCIFEFQAYLSLPPSTYLAIGLHLIWFMYCIQCTATLLLFGVQSMCIRTYLFFLYIHTYVSIYILYLYCTLHCIKILSPEFEWLCIVKLNLYVISLNLLLFIWWLQYLYCVYWFLSSSSVIAFYPFLQICARWLFTHSSQCTVLYSLPISCQRPPWLRRLN